MAQPTNDLLTLWLKAKNGLSSTEALLLVECLSDVYATLGRGDSRIGDARDRINAFLWNH